MFIYLHKLLLLKRKAYNVLYTKIYSKLFFSFGLKSAVCYGSTFVGMDKICIGKNCGVSMPQRKIEELEEKTGMKIVERVCLGRCGKQKVVKINGEIKNYDLEDELEKILFKSKKIRS